MPRLSLWKSGRHSNDYRYLDRTINEMFTVGATDLHVHRYEGVIDQASTDFSQPGGEGVLAIQDLLWGETRDRKYSDDVYVLRGHYSPQDNDLSLEQFGLMYTGEYIYITFHINEMVDRLGRKIIAGDVLELPHLLDFWGANDDIPIALKRYYVVDDASNASEGFSPTWWPHLWRVKAKPMTDSQEYSDILNRVAEDRDGDPVPGGATLKDLLSTYQKEIANNSAIIAQADAEVPLSGYDTRGFYIVTRNADGTLGEPEPFTNADGSPGLPDTPPENGWIQGFNTGDGLGPNGWEVTTGVAFPDAPSIGDYVLRLDFMPNRLFRFDGVRWVKVEDVRRADITPGTTDTQINGFVNNTNTTVTNDKQVIDERVDLKDAFRIKEDN